MIPLNDVSIEKESVVNVVNALMKDEISGTKGNYIGEFERVIAFLCDRKYGISTSSGTSAIHLALLSLGIGKGDEVIVPNITMAATAFAVLYTGAKPILVDIDKDTWCIDTDKIEDSISENTKAIIPVHLYGNPCKMGAIYDICDKYNLEIIEDCAEAIGAKYRDKPVGSFGIAGCHSFYATKMVSCGEGGMIVTNNKCINHNTKNLRNMAFGPSTERYRHERIGYNYRLSNIAAAIGLGHVEKLDDIIKGKTRVFNFYEGYTYGTYQKKTPHSFHCRWMIGGLFDNRNEIKSKLNKNHIQTGDIFTPLNELPFMKDKGDYPVSKKIYEHGLLLPSGYNLGYEDVYIIGKYIND